MRTGNFHHNGYDYTWTCETVDAHYGPEARFDLMCNGKTVWCQQECMGPETFIAWFKRDNPGMKDGSPRERVVEFANECYTDKDLERGYRRDCEVAVEMGWDHSRKELPDTSSVAWKKEWWSNCYSWSRYHLNGQEQRDYMSEDYPPGVGR